jgi:hypothetical protein
MSVFAVQLTQGVGRTAQGALDPDVLSVSQSGLPASIQRTMYCPGPNKTNRVLFDGQTFTDVNYWKRFTYAVTGDYSTAFINVLVDDGSVWNDDSPENFFPRSYTITAASGSTYAANVVNVLQDNGSPAVFTQITVSTAGSAPTFRFNGLASALLSIGNGTTQVFDNGDLQVTKIEIDNSQSGNATATVDIFLSIQALPQS